MRKATAPVLADYAGVLRRANGHIDTGAMIERLRQLHVTSYAYLIWGWRYQAKPYYDSDFDDFEKEFMPAAQQAGIEVWAYLPSPLEMSLHAPPPCRGDYACWGTELGRVGAKYSRLTTIVIDDFFSKPNTGKLTPNVVREMRANAKGLRIYPIAYFTGTMQGLLQRDYTGVIDGIVFVNLNRTMADTNAYLPDQLAQVSRVLKEPVTALRLHVPASNELSRGEATSLEQSVHVGSGDYTVTFGEGDDLYGKSQGTSAVAGGDGTRMLQLLVNGHVCWEHDLNAPPAAGETPGFQRRSVRIDPTYVTAGKTATVKFRVIASATSPVMPDIDVSVYDVGGTNLAFRRGSPWLERSPAASRWHAETATLDYHSPRIVMMVYGSRLSDGWAPDSRYVVQAVSWGHDRMREGQLDGVITYQLDKRNLGTGSTFAQLASLYEQWGH